MEKNILGKQLIYYKNGKQEGEYNRVLNRDIPWEKYFKMQKYVSRVDIFDKKWHFKASQSKSPELNSD